MKHFFFIVIMLSTLLTTAQKDSLLINKLLSEAFNFEATSPLKALKTYKKTHQLSVENKYYLGAFKSLQYIGIVHSDLSNYDSAIYYYRKAIPFSQLIDYKKGIASTYINIGNAYQFKGKLDSVLDNYMKGIKVFEVLKDSSTISQSYANLATFFGSINQLKKQINYLNKADELCPKNNLILKGYITNDLGQTHLKNQDNTNAFQNITKAYTIAKSINNDQLLFFTTRNFGEYYLKQRNYKKAIVHYEKALTIVNNLNEVFYKNDLLLQLGEAYLLNDDNSEAIINFKEVLNFGREKKLLSVQMKAHTNLAKTYNITKNYSLAYSHLIESFKLKDSILNIEHLKKINELEKQFESEKKDKELAEKQIALEQKTIELSKRKSQFNLATISGVILLIILISVWYVYMQRQKLKNFEISKLEKERDISKLQALIEGEEKERNRLAQDLHDGINGDLSSIKYQLSSINTTQFSDENKIMLDKAIDMIDFSCDQVRNISHNLSPTTISEFGLVTSLKNYCTKLESFHPIIIDFQNFGNAIQLSKNNETVIYRIVQELVNNIIKHAEASEALVQINSHDDNIFITVEDNGKGIKNTSKNQGIGLRNIASRVAFLNASFEEDYNSNGTTFTLNIDLTNIPKT